MRLAVIGVGAMGRNHARVFSKLDGVDLVSVADVNAEVAAQVGKSHNAKAYSDYKEMLHKEDLDAITVAVPTREHREVALATIEMGISLMIEKPISSSVAEGEEILARAKERNVCLMVGHLERCNPAVIELEKQLEQGSIGPIYQMHASRVGPFTTRIRDVGVAIDLATHDLDIMLHLNGSNVERAYAEIRENICTEHDDLFSCLLRFANGVVATLDVNWVSPYKNRWLSVLGELGKLEVDYQAQTLDFFPNYTTPGGAASLLSRPQTRDIVRESLVIPKCEPLITELESFVDVVANGGKPLVSGEDGLRALKLALELVDVGRNGEVISFTGDNGR